jgi:hypothetical protein
MENNEKMYSIFIALAEKPNELLESFLLKNNGVNVVGTYWFFIKTSHSPEYVATYCNTIQPGIKYICEVNEFQYKKIFLLKDSDLDKNFSFNSNCVILKNRPVINAIVSDSLFNN